MPGAPAAGAALTAAQRPACGQVPDGEPAGLCLVHQENPLS